MHSKTICFTGHRPAKLGGYRPTNPTALWTKSELRRCINKCADDTWFISGGALGVDQWAAEIVLSIPSGALTIARPFPAQASAWPQESQDYYHSLCARTLLAGGQVVDVSDGPYSAEKMQLRNCLMVDASQYVIAVWDGTPGGTGNCVAYAREQGRKIYQINPQSRVCGWM